MKKEVTKRVTGTLDTLVRATNQCNEAFAALKKAEREWNAAALNTTPKEWRRRVDKVADMKVRIQAACIVWWDHFASRKATDPWTHLDEYRTAWKLDQNADAKKVRKALIQIGYPEHFADARRSVEDPNEA